MIAFEAPLTGENPKNAQVQLQHRRTMVAVMALLMSVGAVALTSTNNQIPSDHPVLACGSTPGFCPNPPTPTNAAVPPGSTASP